MGEPSPDDETPPKPSTGDDVRLEKSRESFLPLTLTPDDRRSSDYPNGDGGLAHPVMYTMLIPSFHPRLDGARQEKAEKSAIDLWRLFAMAEELSALLNILDTPTSSVKLSDPILFKSPLDLNRILKNLKDSHLIDTKGQELLGEILRKLVRNKQRAIFVPAEGFIPNFFRLGEKRKKTEMGPHEFPYFIMSGNNVQGLLIQIQGKRQIFLPGSSRFFSLTDEEQAETALHLLQRYFPNARYLAGFSMYMQTLFFSRLQAAGIDLQAPSQEEGERISSLPPIEYVRTDTSHQIGAAQTEIHPDMKKNLEAKDTATAKTDIKTLWELLTKEEIPLLTLRRTAFRSTVDSMGVITELSLVPYSIEVLQTAQSLFEEVKAAFSGEKTEEKLMQDTAQQLIDMVETVITKKTESSNSHAGYFHPEDRDGIKKSDILRDYLLMYDALTREIDILGKNGKVNKVSLAEDDFDPLSVEDLVTLREKLENVVAPIIMRYEGSRIRRITHDGKPATNKLPQVLFELFESELGALITSLVTTIQKKQAKTHQEG